MRSQPAYINTSQKLSVEKPMILVAVHRQNGKTTHAQMISDTCVNHLYFNWDIPKNRTRLIENPVFPEKIERQDRSKPLIIYDEIQKHEDWKNYLTGIYDQSHKEFQFLISGGGRLDLYRRGGDLLAGRYYVFYLWPFTLAEGFQAGRSMDDFKNNLLEVNMDKNTEMKDIWSSLAAFMDFPESHLIGQKTSYRRWSDTYLRQLICEDIRNLTNIKAIGNLETLYHLLPSKVVSPLSVLSLSRDLKRSYNTIRHRLETFERFFLIFSIAPGARKVALAIQKECKIYLWDIPHIADQAARVENKVVLELYRSITIGNDIGCGRFSLYFIKNKDQQAMNTSWLTKWLRK